MAATLKLQHLIIPQNPSFSSRPSLSSRSLIPSFLSRRQFPAFSAALTSSAAALRPPTTAGNIDSLPGVVNPALKNANLLFFNSGYNVQILVEDNEPDDVLLRRFRREVSKAGVIQECKRRRFFENRRDEKKRKKREAGRRNRRRRFLVPRSSPSSSSQEEKDAAKDRDDDADDNWEYRDVDFP